MTVELFSEVRPISDVAQNILKKRYFKEGESSWKDVVNRVVNSIIPEWDEDSKGLFYQMLLNTYIVPNSPCLVNAGTKNGGNLACFVVDFNDSIEEIYKTKLEFALIAKKGGGCGTTLSKIRPENEIVNGSAHGYAGGPIKFADTISFDMETMTQAGFRSMAIMFVISVNHPDIKKFITAKHEEGRLHNANISVMVDNQFMQKVENDEEYTTYFDFPDGRKLYETYKARNIFNLIVEGAWRNGEPGIIFYDRINSGPYQITGQEILATNPCAEQMLPPNGSCNLASLDISKFLNEDLSIDLMKLEVATRLGIRFLDSVIDKTFFPTKDIEKWAKDNRPVGIGIMGFSDYLLKRKVAYGSKQSLEELEFIMKFINEISEDESITLGEEKGIPKQCKKLPIPRRNITLTMIAPTGTCSLIAGCTSGIEPIFSEITIRNDKTGTYIFNNNLIEEDYFRCAVSSNGAKEVTWQEHLDILNSAQKFVQAGVSKTVNCPNHTRKETVADIFMEAWKHPFIKAVTIYRNGSRKVEVLSPKNLKKDKCPQCGEELSLENDKKICKNCKNDP